MPQKVNSSGNGSDVIIILTRHNPFCFELSGRDVFKNIGLLDYIFLFSNYRPLPLPEVTLLSPKTP